MIWINTVVVLYLASLNELLASNSCPESQYLNSSGICIECSQCRGPREVVIQDCSSNVDTICGSFIDHPSDTKSKQSKKKFKSTSLKKGIPNKVLPEIVTFKGGKHIKKDLSKEKDVISNKFKSTGDINWKPLKLENDLENVHRNSTSERNDNVYGDLKNGTIYEIKQSSNISKSDAETKKFFTKKSIYGDADDELDDFGEHQKKLKQNDIVKDSENIDISDSAGEGDNDGDDDDDDDDEEEDSDNDEADDDDDDDDDNDDDDDENEDDPDKEKEDDSHDRDIVPFPEFGTDRNTFLSSEDYDKDDDDSDETYQRNKEYYSDDVNIERYSDGNSWQLLILVSAASACLLFFAVINIYLCIHMSKWKHMKQNLETDVEDLSVRINLMQHSGFDSDESGNFKNFIKHLKENKNGRTSPLTYP